MAAFNKFNSFVQELGKGSHNFSSHTVKIMLTNTAPTATNAVKADLTDITAGNGYTAGGTAIGSLTWTNSSGTSTLGGANVVFTASGGSIGPFRYAAAYNDTQTSPAKPLVGWWDYGSAVTLNSGETLTVDLTSNILTLA